MNPPSTVPSRGKLMITLLAAQVCGSTAHSMSLAVGSIMAAVIAGTNTASGPGVLLATGKRGEMTVGTAGSGMSRRV